MNENTRNLKIIYDYCKSHRIDSYEKELRCNCPLKRNCIKGNKKSRYNDPRFVNKCVSKVERVLVKEREELEQDPFAEFEPLEKLKG